MVWIPFFLRVPWHWIPCLQSKRVEETETTERRLQANDSEYNAQFNYAANEITTSKYNFLTFLPVNLFEQFQRAANLYFLLQIIIMSIPAITALNPLATAIPLMFVLAATAIKDAYDDIGRHQSDSRVNNRVTLLLRDERIVEEKWSNIKVGDVIKLESDHHVTADIILLSTSEPSGLCFIETAELDGETNLKVRQPLIQTAEMGDNLKSLSSFKGEVACETPNNTLDRFHGTLEWNGNDKLSLDNSNICLRGCILRNTEWVFGLVIFAGHDTKLMMNSGTAVFKRTKLDKLANVLVIWIAIALMGICTFLSIMSYVWEKETGKYFQVYLPWETFYENSPAIIALMHWPAFIMVLNTLIPISLYISIEIIRLGQSLLINFDINMYHEKSDTPAKARNTTLSEELGQIQYVFSDKTGTLTQNVMTFKECSINGKLYGHIDEDPTDKVGLAPDEIKDNSGQILKRIDFSNNRYADDKFTFYDKTLIEDCKASVLVSEFFRLLALCHTVMVEEKKKEDNDEKKEDNDFVDYIPGAETQDIPLLEYQAQSPDEGALVSAARNFGYVFTNRTPNTVTLNVHGKEEHYEVLAILDFDNVRKRMSVIVKGNGKIMLYCKGADTIIYERLSSQCQNIMETTTDHLDMFACNGLRTLCLAYKEIEEKEFSIWWEKYNEASCLLDNRDEQLSEVYEEIERDMILLGATAVEDKLQDGVPDTIANLAEADIKLWVLTGDKQETAVNIGYSCFLLTENMIDVFIINGKDKESVRRQIVDSKAKIDETVPSVAFVSPLGSPIVKQNTSGITLKSFAAADFTENDQADENSCLETKEGFGLVITGQSLTFALDKDMELEFLELGKACKSVICCRVTPLQKALVVDLVKRHVKATTLSIGDGANDVSMIKAAHIGVGISGQEGMQAVLSSDYSIAQFRFLEKLLLVHGRWSYLRMCKFLNYFFYKNFAFTLVQFWHNLFVGYSAQTLYDSWFISFYNVCFTSLPVLALGIFDQDVSDQHCLQYPRLYVPGQKDVLFNKKSFLLKLVHGIITSIILYFIAYGTFLDSITESGLSTGTYQLLATAVACTLVITVNLQIALDTQHWTWINHFFIWGSIIFYFIYSFTLYAETIYPLSPATFTFVGMALNTFGCGQFWLCLILSSVMCLVPLMGYRWVMSKVRPTLSDLVRRGEWKERRKDTPSLISLRRSRRSFRSRPGAARSGYAFSHQSGFGDLIMSGKWLPKFKFRHSKGFEIPPSSPR